MYSPTMQLDDHETLAVINRAMFHYIIEDKNNPANEGKFGIYVSYRFTMKDNCNGSHENLTGKRAKDFLKSAGLTYGLYTDNEQLERVLLNQPVILVKSPEGSTQSVTFSQFFNVGAKE